MEIQMNKNLKLFFPNYFSFFFNGAIVLLLGSVLPFIIQETGISYTVAGTMLSLFALGNFSASLVNPILSKLLGRKNSILITSIFHPFSLFFLTLKLPVFVFMGKSLGRIAKALFLFQSVYVCFNYTQFSCSASGTILQLDISSARICHNRRHSVRQSFIAFSRIYSVYAPRYANAEK